jgi:hypothetical protein
VYLSAFAHTELFVDVFSRKHMGHSARPAGLPRAAPRKPQKMVLANLISWSLYMVLCRLQAPSHQGVQAVGRPPNQRSVQASQGGRGGGGSMPVQVAIEEWNGSIERQDAAKPAELLHGRSFAASKSSLARRKWTTRGELPRRKTLASPPGYASVWIVVAVAYWPAIFEQLAPGCCAGCAAPLSRHEILSRLEWPPVFALPMRCCALLFAVYRSHNALLYEFVCLSSPERP